MILVLLLYRETGGARITTIGGARSLQRSREIQNDEKTRRKDAREGGKILLRRSKKSPRGRKQKRPMYMMLWGTMGEILAALVGRLKERTQAKPAGQYQHNRQFDTMQWCREKHQKNSHHRSHFHLLPLNFLHRKSKEPVDKGIKGWPLA